MAWTVSQVSAFAHVSVRALHHYDEIGLVRPSQRSDAGYRLYAPGDLERLQQALFFKELGFGLEEIREILDDPTFDRVEALEVQRDLLAEKAAHLGAMIDAVDATLAAARKGVTMDEKDMFDVFGEFDPKRHEDEARERWGDTEAYKVSMRRTKSYTKDDWLRVKAEQRQVQEDFAEAMRSGAAADSERAMDIAERHRLGIDRWFYPCSHEMQVGLGRMYVADPRFAKNYDDLETGLSKYVCDAIEANAERARKVAEG